MRPSLKAHLVMHLIMVIFVGFPAWVTWMLPASWVTFTRDDGQVSMKARVCLLYLIPYQNIELAGVETVESEIKPGKKMDIDPGSWADDQTSEAMGKLILRGNGGSAELQVDAGRARMLESSIQRYLADPAEAELSLFITAHRAIGIFCGIWAGLFLSIYALYLLSWTVPARAQLWLLDRILKRLRPDNAIRSAIESRLAKEGMRDRPSAGRVPPDRQ